MEGTVISMDVAMADAAESMPMLLPSTSRPHADPDLARVLQLAEQVVPGLHGEQHPDPLPGALHVDGPAGDDALRALCRHWAQAYPEAGPHYLALRSWGLAIWQPVYLMVIAAHLDTHVPHLDGFTQPVVNGFPAGFRLPPHAPMRGDLVDRMQFAAAELRRFCTAMREALSPKTGLHVRGAHALQAECVLGALLSVRRHLGAMPVAALEDLGRRWLELLGITGSCGFFPYRARDGTCALALDRTVCCHHFRRRDGEKCRTCPKLPIDERIGRLLAEPS